MKIIKAKNMLTEANNELEVVSIDTNNGQEVLDKVEAAAKGSGITNTADIAAQVVDAAATIGSTETVVDLNQEESIAAENKITRALDQCLRATKRFKKLGGKEVANVLISGLPGSGKTASVYDWANNSKTTYNGQRVNIVYLNMKNNDLDAYINGYTGLDKNDPDYAKQLLSRNLDDLDQPNAILFLDEYNRQTSEQIRSSVYTLINEHYIVGKNKGRRNFPNFLFTIAVMNPTVRTDRGASPLNDAEKTRFLYYFENMDSDPKTTHEFLVKFYNKKIKDELAEQEPDYDFIEDCLRIIDLGTFLVDDHDFAYDGMDKLDELARRHAKMLNQRALTTGVAACGGDPDDFRAWLNNGAGFLSKERPTDEDNTLERLLTILDEYVRPTRKELFDTAGIIEGQKPKAVDKKAELATPTEKEAEQVLDTTTEDDVDFDKDAEALRQSSTDITDGEGTTSQVSTDAADDEDEGELDWTNSGGQLASGGSTIKARAQATVDAWGFN